MYNITTYNKGVSFCNLISNKLINEFNKVDFDHKSRITVTDHGNFVIINGRTSIPSFMNSSEILNQYIKDLKINRTLNIIDLIDYNHEFKKQSELRIISDLSTSLKISNLIESLEKNYVHDFNIDIKNDLIFSDIDISEILNEAEFKSYKLVNRQKDFPYVSDDFYGMSLDLEKNYKFYLNYVTYNIFSKQLCKDLIIDLKINDTTNVNHDTVDLNLYSESKITSMMWLKSMILDLFKLQPEEITKKFDLKNHDFEKDIINLNSKSWQLRDKTKEMITF